jgi:hypothetical protein
MWWFTTYLTSAVLQELCSGLPVLRWWTFDREWWLLQTCFLALDPQASWWELNGNGIAFWVTLAILALVVLFEIIVGTHQGWLVFLAIYYICWSSFDGGRRAIGFKKMYILALHIHNREQKISNRRSASIFPGTSTVINTNWGGLLYVKFSVKAPA